MVKKVRKIYTREQREEILAKAAADSLTAIQVKEKFGVSPVTYYAWRKKAAKKTPAVIVAKPANGHVPMLSLDGKAVKGQVETAIRTKLRALVPKIMSQEIERLFK